MKSSILGQFFHGIKSSGSYGKFSRKSRKKGKNHEFFDIIKK